MGRSDIGTVNVSTYVYSTVHKFKCSNVRNWMYECTSVRIYKNLNVFEFTEIRMYECSNVRLSTILFAAKQTHAIKQKSANVNGVYICYVFALFMPLLLCSLYHVQVVASIFREDVSSLTRVQQC